MATITSAAWTQILEEARQEILVKAKKENWSESWLEGELKLDMIEFSIALKCVPSMKIIAECYNMPYNKAVKRVMRYLPVIKD